MTRRRKTEIGVFRRNPTEIPRNNRFTNARKTGILYHVLAPVAQLDRALDSDSKGHAFESHQAYHFEPLVSLKQAVFLYFLVNINHCKFSGDRRGD